MVVHQFNALYPEMNVKFINRGIGGHRTKDLVARWQNDCINLKPDVVSILIGVNDTWRRFDSNDPTSAYEFEKNYRTMLDMIRVNLPETKIIIMESFLIEINEEQKQWREDLDEKREIVRKLAKEYKTEFIPLDDIFKQVRSKCEYPGFSADGVHPTYRGSALIAEHWLKCVGAR